jgi:hypothetical protein
MDVVIARANDHLGLELKQPRTQMPNDRFRLSEGFDYRRRGAARVRQGYAQLGTGDQVIIESNEETDNFNGYGPGDLRDETDWTGRGTAGLLEVDGTLVKDALGNTVIEGCEHNAGSYAADQFAEVRIVNIDPGIYAGFGCGVLLRSDSTRGYCFFAWAKSSFVVGYAVTDWSDPVFGFRYLGSWDAGVSWINGNHLLNVAMVGTTIYLFVNGVSIGSLVDTAYASGTPGVAIWGAATVTAATVEMDDYRGGDAARTFTAVRATAEPSRLMSFERDDEEVQLVSASGGTIESFEAGVAAW